MSRALAAVSRESQSKPRQTSKVLFQHRSIGPFASQCNYSWLGCPTFSVVYKLGCQSLIGPSPRISLFSAPRVPETPKHHLYYPIICGYQARYAKVFFVALYERSDNLRAAMSGSTLRTPPKSELTQILTHLTCIQQYHMST
jgi:hypothetical protein